MADFIMEAVLVAALVVAVGTLLYFGVTSALAGRRSKRAHDRRVPVEERNRPECDDDSVDGCAR